MISEYLPQLQQAAPVIISLIIIEGLLSVDNILAIAALASQLPEKQKKTALRLGLAGAYTFRIVALFFAGFIMENEWVKFLGAFYLIHLLTEHLCNHIAATDDDPETVETKPRAFWQTILAIQLMDLSLSVDNVVAAVAMSPDIRVVCIGVFLGLLTLLMFATVSLKLVEKFPILEHTAFFLIGYVGLILLTELSVGYFFHAYLHITPVQKFFGIVIIMLISLWYARSPALQKFCQPFFKVAMVPVRFYAMLVGGLIGVLLWPFRRLVAAFAAKA